MDLIQKFMNIFLPPLTLIALLLVVPPYLVLKFLYGIKRLMFSENVAGKVVIITGAASGIGKEIAYEYASRGACLALVDVKEDSLGPVVDKAKALGSPDVISIYGDVSRVEDCQRFVHAAMHHFGQLDHLVNNAGTARVALFHKVNNVSDLTPIMDINFWGSVYGTHFAIPHLRRSKGKIVVIASAAGWFPLPGNSIYSASKAALIRFYETLRTEIGSDIGITIVTPGFINTDLLRNQPSETQLADFVPKESPEECAKQIVNSACHGDRYLVEPSWVRVLYPWTLLCLDLVEYVTRRLIIRCKGANRSYEQKKD